MGAVEGLCAEPPAGDTRKTPSKGKILQAAFILWGSEQHWNWDSLWAQPSLPLKHVGVSFTFLGMADGRGERREKEKK